MVILLTLAACGGDGGSEEESGTTIEAASETTSGPAPTEAPAPTESPSDDAIEAAAEMVDGQGEATVTLDGKTYYFGDAGHPALQCLPDFFGVMMAFLQRVDENGGAIEGGGGLQLVLLREGTDPVEVDQLNEMIVQLDDLDQEWIADETHADEREIEMGMSQVDSVSFSGNTATGSATLYEEESYYQAGGDASLVATATATFELTCTSE